MNKILRFFSIVFGVAVAVLVIVKPADAITIGISPSSLINTHLRPGTIVENNFTLSLAELDNDVQVDITSDFPGFENWITFYPATTFTFKKDQKTQNIKAKISVPANAELKNYSGTFHVNAKNPNLSQNTASIISGTLIKVDLSVTNEVFEKFFISAASLSGTQNGKLITIDLNFNNEGNVPVSFTKGELEVTDLTNKLIDNYIALALPTISPFQQIILPLSFPSSLIPGQYNAKIKLSSGENLVYQNTFNLPIDNQTDSTKTDNVGENPFRNNISILIIILVLIIISLIGIFLFKIDFFKIKKINNKTPAIKYNKPPGPNKLLAVFLFFLSFVLFGLFVGVKANDVGISVIVQPSATPAVTSTPTPTPTPTLRPTTIPAYVSFPTQTPAEFFQYFLLNNYTQYLDGTGKLLEDIRVGQVINFVADNTDYVITIKNISGNNVTVSFGTNLIDINLNIGEIRQVDVNGDGINDIQVNLISLQNGKANFVFAKLFAPDITSLPETGITFTPTVQPNLFDVVTTNSQSYQLSMFYLCLCLSIALLLILFILFWKRRRKSEEQLEKN